MTLLAVVGLTVEVFGFPSEVAAFFLAAPTFVLDASTVEVAVAGGMAVVVSLLLLLFLLPLALLLLLLLLPLDGTADDDDDDEEEVEEEEDDGAWFTLTAPQPVQGMSVLGIVRLHGMQSQDITRDGAVGFLAAVEGLRQFFPTEEEKEEEVEVYGL